MKFFGAIVDRACFGPISRARAFLWVGQICGGHCQCCQKHECIYSNTTKEHKSDREQDRKRVKDQAFAEGPKTLSSLHPQYRKSAVF